MLEGGRGRRSSLRRRRGGCTAGPMRPGRQGRAGKVGRTCAPPQPDPSTVSRADAGRPPPDGRAAVSVRGRLFWSLSGGGGETVMAGGGRQAAGGVGTPGGSRVRPRGRGWGCGAFWALPRGRKPIYEAGHARKAPKRSPRTRSGRPADGADAGAGCTLRRQKETAFATPLPVPLGTRGLRRANAAEEI